VAVEEVQKLFLRHSGVLRGFILGLLADRSLAEDALQETFLTITRKAEQFAPGSNFLAWARSIARIKVLEACRASRDGVSRLGQEALEALAQEAPHAEDDWEERREALARCLDQLAPRAREIIGLRYSDDHLAPPAIAGLIQWSVNAVNVALSRARKFLQECTRRRLAQEGHRP
jgi:RNA polymerase sigma-70 factor (ECF subfamily)